MKVIILSAGADTGGVGHQLALALNRVPGVEALDACRSTNYIDYPRGLLWPLGDPVPPELADFAARADVLHVMESWDACRWIAGWQDRPLVLHHHGSILRANHGMLTRSAREVRAVTVVSTPDLQLIDPGAEWLPNPVDIAAMMRRRFPGDPNPVFTVVHTPTNRAYKSTDLAAAAARAAGVALDLVERSTWEESLARKARADAVFDQLRSGYGLSGLEAMAMGLPVIGGALDPDLAALGVPGGTHLLERLASLWGYLPFLAATEATLADRMAELRDDPDLAQQTARAGVYHANRWHDSAKVAAQLVQVYRRAIEAKR